VFKIDGNTWKDVTITATEEMIPGCVLVAWFYQGAIRVRYSYGK